MNMNVSMQACGGSWKARGGIVLERPFRTGQGVPYSFLPGAHVARTIRAPSTREKVRYAAEAVFSTSKASGRYVRASPELV